MRRLGKPYLIKMNTKCTNRNYNIIIKLCTEYCVYYQNKIIEPITILRRYYQSK